MSDFSTAPVFPVSGTFLPVLLGTTDNPTAVSYAANGQVGYYTYFGNMCRFAATIITTSFSKTTLADAVRLSLPFPMASITGLRVLTQAQTTGSGVAKPATSGYMDAGNGFLTLQQNGLLGSPIDVQYLLSNLGLLSTQMRFDVSGVYPI